MSTLRLAAFLLVLGLFFAVVAWIKSPDGGEVVAEGEAPVIVRVSPGGEVETSGERRPVSLRPSYRDDGRSVAQRIEDTMLATKIKKALAQERSLRGFTVEPAVMRGEVTLLGSVRTQAQRAQAAQLVRRIDGVRDLQNKLTAAEESLPPLARQKPRPPEKLPSVATASEKQPPEKEAVPATEAAYHTVQAGESLWVIAQKYDTSIRSVKRLNELRSDHIQPGQALRVK